MSIKKNVVAAACGLALAASAFAPSLAFAATDGNGSYTDANTAETKITVKVAGDESNPQLNFSIPTELAFAAHGDGSLTAADFIIQNQSIFPIHVKKVEIVSIGSDPWLLVSNEAMENNQGLGKNSWSATFNGEDVYGLNGKTDDLKWVMEPRGAADDKDKISFTPTGKVANLSKDISTVNEVAKVTWTLAYGK